MTLSDIHLRLNRHLLELPAAPPVFFDNAPVSEMPLTGVFIEAVLLPESRRVVDFCLSVERRGIYSINIFVPLSKGAIEAIDLSEKVAQHFAHQTLAGVQCLNADINRVGKVGEHFVYNVSVDLRA